MSKNRVDEIYNMILASDGDFDTVAQIITDDLNAALARYQEKDKEAAAQELADHFNEFISTYLLSTSLALPLSSDSFASKKHSRMFFSGQMQLIENAEFASTTFF